MIITWFTENYPPNKGGMSRSCDRIIANLRQHHTIHVFHFTNKFQPFLTEAQENGSYTSIPVYEDSSHTINMLWAFIKNNPTVLDSDALVSFGSHLCLKGIPLFSQWLQKPNLVCIRGNDFDTAIFSRKKHDLLYAIEHASAIACVTKEKVDRITSLNLNNNVFFTPNAIHFENWEVLQSDIGLAQHYKTSLNLDDTKHIIGLIGFLKQKKGIDFFLNTLIKSRLIDSVHLHIVGELEPQIEDKLVRLNLAYSKVLPESQSELIANYLVCNAIAIPSIYDGMPNVLFEAAALEIPVIASDAGGMPDVLDNNNSFLFEVLSEKSMLNALADFDEANPTDLENKTNLLKQKLQSEFNTEQETKKYLDIFNHIKK